MPIVFLVLVLNFTVVQIDGIVLWRFLMGAVLIVVGLGFFLLGVEIGIEPIGKSMGTAITKLNKTWIVILAGIILGFFVSIAEPDLHILASQVASVTAGVITKNVLLVVVSVGIAGMLTLGLLRILYNIAVNWFLLVCYGVIFLLSLFTPLDFLAISFDASGATTGALAVPFILALAFGVSSLKKDSKASEADSFGLVAIASVGAIIAMLVMRLLSPSNMINKEYTEEAMVSLRMLQPFIVQLPIMFKEMAVALFPIVMMFLFMQFTRFRLPKAQVRKIAFGVFYTLLGLILFMTGVHAGFMKVGSVVGYQLAMTQSSLTVIAVGFVLGFVTVLAEPAVHSLTNQIEFVTSGYVKRQTVLLALSFGIGLAVAFSMLRIIIPWLQLWHFLLPGYSAALIISFIVPKLFVGMAFDSGGVASGPMTATFILAFAQGAAKAIDTADVLLDGFGIIALIAMTPIITIQLLGLVYNWKAKKGK